MSRIKRLNVTRNGAIVVGLTGLNIAAFSSRLPLLDCDGGDRFDSRNGGNRAQQLKEQDELKAKTATFCGN